MERWGADRALWRRDQATQLVQAGQSSKGARLWARSLHHPLFAPTSTAQQGRDWFNLPVSVAPRTPPSICTAPGTQLSCSRRADSGGAGSWLGAQPGWSNAALAPAREHGAVLQQPGRRGRDPPQRPVPGGLPGLHCLHTPPCDYRASPSLGRALNARQTPPQAAWQPALGPDGAAGFATSPLPAPAYTTTVSAGLALLCSLPVPVFAVYLSLPAALTTRVWLLGSPLLWLPQRTQVAPPPAARLQANVGLGRDTERRVFLHDPTPGALQLPRIEEDQALQGARSGSRWPRTL